MSEGIYINLGNNSDFNYRSAIKDMVKSKQKEKEIKGGEL